MAKITEFKKGDVLTRNEPITYPTGVVDSSYCGDKMILLEISEESKCLECNILILNKHFRMLVTYGMKAGVFTRLKTNYG